MARKSMKTEKKKVSAAPSSGKLEKLIKVANSKSTGNAAFDLKKDNPSQIPYWIPTGSLWLDTIIAKGKVGGYPGGKIIELAGLSATGKSYLAAQAAANAQRMGLIVVYFDSESAIDSGFLELAGVNIDELLYIQAQNVEYVLGTIEDLMAADDSKFLFIWDSLANTPSVADINSSYDPTSSIAVTARVLSKGLKKLTIPLANHKSVLLVCNQLKTNIGSDAYAEPLVTPGGKAFDYAASLRLFLLGRKAQKWNVLDENGYKIGSDVKVKLKKSRFGTEQRECFFKILWGGDDVRVQDEESWLEAVKISDDVVPHGGWYWVYMDDKKRDDNHIEKVHGAANFVQKLKDDEKFAARIKHIMTVKLVERFANRQGKASDFYDVEPEVEE